MTSDSFIHQHGTPEPLPQPRWLSAGPCGVLLDEGQLRGIHCGGVEMVRRIYGAVRDRFWNTVPGVITELKVEERGGGFRVSFCSEHVSGEVDFVWRAVITGTPDGAVEYVFDGAARRDMAKNRIGLCVLLPLRLCGTAAQVDYVSGDRAEVRFPQLVDPLQPVRGLHDFRALSCDGMRVEFEGDVFEIEDQRNWTDASFKAYSTPQRIPMPAQMRAGQRVRQVVRVQVDAAEGAAFVPPVEPAEIVITHGAAAGKLPALGTGVASHGEPLSAEELSRLAALGLAHYRLEIDPAKEGWPALLARGLAEAAAMQCAAEVAVFLSDDAAAAAAEARAAVAVPGKVSRWIMLTRGAPATRASTAAAAGPVLRAGGAAAGCGTDADFFQLNNNRPAAASADFVSVPLRPCAHQFDRATIIENLDGQREVLRSLAALYPGQPLAVSPVSFRTRAQKGPLPCPGELPAQADVRQMSLLGAAWTVGCLKALAESGVASATLFQTTGVRGLMERAAGPEAPAHFHSTPGMLFPVYDVLAALAGWHGAEVTALHSSHPHLADGIALRKDGHRRVLLANYTPQPRTLRTGLHGTALLTLSPFEVAVVDASD